MKKSEYKRLVEKICPKEDIIKNMFISFISGGSLGLIGQLLSNYFIVFFDTKEFDSYLYVFISYIIIGSILTGIGIFDNILSVCKCGFIVPSTGFANSMTSSSMDYRDEGFVKGIGSNIFKLTGSIIVYGIIFGLIFGFIRGVIL